MRKQIAAANWKMNLNLDEAKTLLAALAKNIDRGDVIIAVPSIYLQLAVEAVKPNANIAVAAQNCHQKNSGAYTGEISAPMLSSLGVTHCLVGHSERRDYFLENSDLLAEKIDACLKQNITPIFCCGEPLSVREAAAQNHHVEAQLRESLFHLSAEDVSKIIIAYEPVWAIGTGKTATEVEAQEMHKHLRGVLAAQYGQGVADNISILYGGSVKGTNAASIFAHQLLC